MRHPVIHLPEAHTSLGLLCPVRGRQDIAILVTVDAEGVINLLRDANEGIDREATVVRPARNARVVSLDDACLADLEFGDTPLHDYISGGDSILLHDDIASLVPTASEGAPVFWRHSVRHHARNWSARLLDGTEVSTYWDCEGSLYLAAWLLGVQNEPTFGDDVYQVLFEAYPVYFASFLRHGPALPGQPCEEDELAFRVTEYELDTLLDCENEEISSAVEERYEDFLVVA
jgi:hypothetical protein